MKVDRFLIGAMLIVLAVVDVVLVVRIFRLRTEVILKDQAIEVLTSSLYLADCTKFNLDVNYLYGGCRIGASETVDTLGISRPVGKLIDRPTLVFRYCEGACGECVSFAADKLYQEMADSEIPVVFFAKYNNIIDLKRLGLTVDPYGFPIFNVLNMIELDEKMTPYYCIIAEDGSVWDIFIPEKSIPSTASKYLNFIKSKYSEI